MAPRGTDKTDANLPDPSDLRIVLFPAAVLRTPADPIDPTPQVRAMAERMIELMHGADGIGLAAPQVGLPWRMFVAHVPPGEGRSPDSDPPAANNGPEVFINPEIIASEGEPEVYDEGCLSLPGITGDVTRPPTVTLAYTTLDGARVERKATGLLARCWQHELDHLDGVLILDKMPSAQLAKNKAAIRNLERRRRKS